MALLFLLLCLPAQAGRDRDLDGVPDKDDQCVSAPEDIDGFEDEDGCPEVDNDRDNRIDEMDQCPDDPEDFDDFQDEDGCPDPDNDGDGVLDRQDQCPNTPGTAGGCPDPILAVFSALDAALQQNNAEAVAALYDPTGYEANLVGTSGLTGSEMARQAQKKGWVLRPEPTTLESIGDNRLVHCLVVERATEKPLDAVWAVLVNRGEWRILGAGEDEAQVRALAEK